MRLSVRLAAAATTAGMLGVVPPTAANATAERPAAAAASAPSGIAAKGAALYDAGTGAALWSRGSSTRRPIGSMSKVMTALVVLRSVSVTKQVTIKQAYVNHVTNNDASSAGLKVGDKVSVRQLLNGMMLPSGCDAAYALADVVGPGQSKFVAKMNKTAASLGMKNTHFLTSDGLPTSTHKEGYSTPGDVVRLARTAMGNSEIRATVARTTYKVTKNNAHHAYTWTNTNLLLGSYGGTIGIKTGHTDGAGYCLLFETTRNGRTLLGVVLNSTTTDANQRFKDAAAMLDWGFGTKSAMLRLRSLPSGAATD
jgi:D-alanyl-D-alanine carboxypeptidase (penicillin-binding protein 5/6)